jgi:hypothetical protein
MVFLAAFGRFPPSSSSSGREDEAMSSLLVGFSTLSVPRKAFTDAEDTN